MTLDPNHPIYIPILGKNYGLVFRWGSLDPMLYQILGQRRSLKHQSFLPTVTAQEDFY
jgi:hypothetical protein